MTSDVELVIGAKNDAKAVLDELSNQFRTLASPINEANAAIQTGLGKFVAGLIGAAATAGGILSTIGVGVAGIATVSTIKAIRDEQDALQALTTQISNYAGATGFSIEEAKAFASALRVSLGVSEKQTLELMTKASVLGVTNEYLDDAALAAIGLAKSLDIDVSAAIAKVVNGDSDLLNMTDSINKGLIAQKQQVTQLASAWNMVTQQTKALTEVMLKALQPIRDELTKLGSSIGSWIITKLIEATTMIQVFQSHTAESMEYASKSVQLFAMQFSSSLEHAFTVAAPAYFLWFTDNFVKLMQDGFNAVLAINRNFNEALGKGLIAVWDFIASGGTSGIDKLKADMLEAIGTLANDFEATAEPLPVIIGRQISKEEQALKNQLGELGSELGQVFQDKFAANKKFMDEILSVQAPQFEKFSQLKAKAPNSSAASVLQATESRLLTRGKVDQGIDKVAKAVNDGNRIQANTNVLLNQIKTIEEGRSKLLGVEVIP